jgi:hypothetical protein
MKRRPVAAPKDEAAQKALAETRELARLHVPQALEELARLARAAESETIRVTAIKEILDRAHGRPAAALGESSGGFLHVLVDDGYRD